MAQLVEYRTGNRYRFIVVHHPQCHIKGMCSDINKRTATLKSFVREYTPCRNCPASYCMCFCKINLTKLSSLTCFMKSLYFWTETVLVANCEFLTGFFPGCKHLVCSFCAVSHRFLTENMLSSFKCCYSCRSMDHVGCKYMNYINGIIFKHFIIVCISFGTWSAILFCCFYSSFFYDVAECNHIA